MGIFWNLWIIGLTLIFLALITWVLFANRKVAVNDEDEPENRTTGHVYDGIEEYDNPLPRWWFNLFVGSMIFGVIWLILYPGLGSFKGVLGWTSTGELQRDEKRAEQQLEKSYGVYSDMPIDALINEPKAMKMGARLFANNCSVCHGADGGGNYGFPNLTDSDWLYGCSPEAILHSLHEGRAGNMPAFSAILGEEKVGHLADYVLQLSGQEHDAEAAALGQPLFAQNCAVCHGGNGKGNHAMGAPNLTDDIWLYEGSREEILHSLRKGRANQMPAQKDILREDKIHILAAYVYSLSHEIEE